MGDITDRSSLTNASLYNGQPLDTGSMFHSAGVASCTPSIQSDRGGVSVENVHTPTKQWHVLRVSYGRVLKAKEIVDARNIECYVPMRSRQVTKHGKKHIVTEPLLPSFIFVRSSLDEVDAMLHDDKVNSIESRPLLSFYFDHTSYRQDNPDRNPPLVIRDEAMQNFINMTSVKNPHIIPVTSENIQFKLGDEVIVTEGDFKGIRGRVARIAGQQRVIVELFSGCLVATAYIPKEAMEKIDKEKE
ncbi:MAG: UpxY family transcription antiterminator [Prevotella sp.]